MESTCHIWAFEDCDLYIVIIIIAVNFFTIVVPYYLITKKSSNDTWSSKTLSSEHQEKYDIPNLPWDRKESDMTEQLSLHYLLN